MTATTKATGAIVDLGAPDGGRYWRVTTGEAADHPDAISAAVHARVTGSVGCTYNGVKVERAEAPEGSAQDRVPYGEPGHVCQRCGVTDCTNHDDRRCAVCGGFEWVGSHVRCE